MRFQNILVATDFSEASEPALVSALDLADQFDGTITLLHAYGLPVFPLSEGGAILPAPQTVADLISDVTRQLDRLRARVARPGTKILTKVVQGPPAEAIVNVARDDNFDLIIMGTHGRTGIKRLALGSVTEHVVRTATTPVLTVHPQSSLRPNSQEAPRSLGA